MNVYVLELFNGSGGFLPVSLKISITSGHDKIPDVPGTTVQELEAHTGPEGGVC